MAQGLSPEVLAETRRFWEERTGEAVSDEDAREAISSISAFFDLLARWERNADDESAQDAEVDNDNGS